MKEQLNNIQQKALDEIKKAVDMKTVDDLKVKLLGKKGSLPPY